MPAGTDYSNVGTAVSSNLKASSGSVYALTCSNQTTTLVWFQLFNKTTAPTNGDTPIRSYPIYGATSTAPGFIVLGSRPFWRILVLLFLLVLVGLSQALLQVLLWLLLVLLTLLLQ